LGLAFLRLTLLWIALLGIALLGLAFLRLTQLWITQLWITLLWITLLWLAFLRLTLRWIALLRLGSAVFGEFSDLFIQLVESFFELSGLLCKLLSFGVLFVELLLFSSLSSFGGFIEWGWGSGIGGVRLCGVFRGFRLLWFVQLLSGIFELLADVVDVLLGLFEVSLTKFAEGIIEWLYSGFGDGLVLLLDFSSELFGVVAGLLQLVGDFLGIASSIAGLFVDSFGKFLLSAGELLELSGSFGGAVELCFASGLEQFLFALEEIIEIAADFLLFLLEALAFLCELLVEFFGLLSGFWSGLSLLLEFFGVISEFFGIECESIEIGEILFELCGALNFFDGAVEFIAAAIEFVGGLLEVLGGGITFGGGGLVEQFGNVLSYVLSEFSEFGGLFLHERVFAGLFGKFLEFVALSLVLFAETAGFLASIFVPVAGGLIAELSGGGGVFAELF
jgi:hypothetical protein